jgi:DNA-binding MarR family transcriptional regulator
VQPIDDDAPLARLLARATRQMADQLVEVQRAAGFADHRAAYNNVLLNIPPEGIRLTDLAERARMTKQAMAELVADLERIGHLRRSPDPTDGRAKVIELTPRGAEAVAMARASLDRLEADLVERLGEAKVRQLRATLLDMLETLPEP